MVYSASSAFWGNKFKEVVKRLMIADAKRTD